MISHGIQGLHMTDMPAEMSASSTPVRSSRGQNRPKQSMQENRRDEANGGLGFFREKRLEAPPVALPQKQ